MKAMDRCKRGNNFLGLLKYLSGREKRSMPPGRLIGGNMSSHDIERLAAEYRAVAKRCVGIKKPVWHQSLRLPPGDVLDDTRWREVGDEYLSRMGFDLENHQYSMWSHDDESAIHLAVNRVGIDGAVYYGRNEHLKSTRITQMLEIAFGLTITKGPEYRSYRPDTGRLPKPVEPPRRKAKRGEQQVIVKTGQQSVRVRLQETIDAALLDAPDRDEFVQRLSVWGVRAIPNVAKTGTMNGFAFELDGVRMKSSALGSSYAWRNLRLRFAALPEADQRGDQQVRGIPTREISFMAPCGFAPTKLAPRPLRDKRKLQQAELDDLRQLMFLLQSRGNALLGWDRRIHRMEGLCLELTWNHHRVLAYYDRIEAKNGDDAEIAAMLEVAKLRGWRSLRVYGNAEIKSRMMVAALRQGFEVEPQSDEDEQLLLRAIDLADGIAQTPTESDRRSISPNPRRPR